MNSAIATASVQAPANGATAVSALGARTAAARRRAGGTLRALRVFAGAAFSVAVLGDHDEPGVVRTRH